MKVEYPVNIGGQKVVFSEEVANDLEAFEFVFRLQELYGNLKCSRNGESSDRVKVNVRTTQDGDKYYEFVCYDTKPELQWAKMSLGISQEDKSLYRKVSKVDKKGKVVRDENGKGIRLPNGGWMQYNKETGEEE